MAAIRAVVGPCDESSSQAANMLHMLKPSENAN